MPTDSAETLIEDVLYPDNLQGAALDIDPEERMNGSLQYWLADDPDDAEVLPDGAKRGHYFPVSVIGSHDGEVWAAAPRDLRARLEQADVGPGDSVEVTELKKSGEGETDPYSARIAVITDG